MGVGPVGVGSSITPPTGFLHPVCIIITFPEKGPKSGLMILAKQQFRHGSEDIRCRGRNFGTRSHEISPDQERGDQKSVFFGAPISRRHYQGRMQKRLSARSSGIVESIG
jgi:hypothetical protein